MNIDPAQGNLHNGGADNCTSTVDGTKGYSPADDENRHPISFNLSRLGRIHYEHPAKADSKAGDYLSYSKKS